jgi:hypothetical protein
LYLNTGSWGTSVNGAFYFSVLYWRIQFNFIGYHKIKFNYIV